MANKNIKHNIQKIIFGNKNFYYKFNILFIKVKDLGQNFQGNQNNILVIIHIKGKF